DGTALAPFWPWFAFVWLTWLVVSVVTPGGSGAHVWGSIFWYLAAVLALTPPIAVLGAKRPTSRVWTWFVLAPLVLVFALPVVTALGQPGGAPAFTLEGPLALGYVLSVLLGAGINLERGNRPPVFSW